MQPYQQRVIENKKRFSVAVIDGDETAYLYNIKDGIFIDQEWPDNWPDVVSASFLKNYCDKVVNA